MLSLCSIKVLITRLLCLYHGAINLLMPVHKNLNFFFVYCALRHEILHPSFQIKLLPSGRAGSPLSLWLTFLASTKYPCHCSVALERNWLFPLSDTLPLNEHWKIVAASGPLGLPCLVWDMCPMSELGWEQSGPHSSQPSVLRVQILPYECVCGGVEVNRPGPLGHACLELSFCNTELGDI